MLFPPEVDAVHVSVTFDWDLPQAHRLAEEWQRVAPVTVGGPATGARGEAFTPGLYLAPGYVITSRGCPNRCRFCEAWKREGNEVREYPIHDGWNVLDDNLLSCSEAHVRAVFAMLKRQRMGRPELTGGLEAARLRSWHVDLLADLHPHQVFFAYDTPNDWEPLVEAGKMLRAAGFVTKRGKRPGSPASSLRCYVLVGFEDDTFEEAEKRLRAAIRAGFLPMAMPYAAPGHPAAPEWRRFADPWVRPAETRRFVPQEWRP